MKHEFVEYIPKELQPDTVYVSMENETVVHSCFCGCGGRVVTPLSPNDWKLTFDGETISLYPSIGSWNLDCRSHYWIRNGKVAWAERWSNAKIEAGRKQVRETKETYYAKRNTAKVNSEDNALKSTKNATSWWERLRSYLFKSRSIR